MRSLGILLVCVVVLLSPALAAAQRQPTPNWVRAVEWSPGGDRIAFATQRGVVQILDSTTGELVIELQGRDPDAVYTLAWSPDGTLLAAGGQSNVTKVWDVATGQVVRELRTWSGYIESLSWSPDSTRIATASQSGYPENVNLWDLSTGDVFPLLVGDATAIAWSPDGALVAVGKADEIQLWDTATRQKVSVIENPWFTTDLAWSQDGTKLASTGAHLMTDFLVILSDTETRQQIQVFEGHTDLINAVSWNPAEDRLASSSDGTVRVWDVASGDALTLYRSADRVFSATFSPYGGRLAFGGTLYEAGAQPIVDSAVAVYAGGAVQIVVPAPSVEQLRAIVADCDAPSDVADSLTASLDAGNLAGLVAQVEVLPPGTIPPACAADVIAVAEAL